jgi:hypothetical protein
MDQLQEKTKTLKEIYKENLKILQKLILDIQNNNQIIIGSGTAKNRTQNLIDLGILDYNYYRHRRDVKKEVLGPLFGAVKYMRHIKEHCVFNAEKAAYIFRKEYIPLIYAFSETVLRVLKNNKAPIQKTYVKILMEVIELLMRRATDQERKEDLEMRIREVKKIYY